MIPIFVEIAKSKPLATKLSCKVAPLSSVRVTAASSDGASVVLHNQNRIQILRLSSKRDALRLQFQADVPGISILFVRQAGPLLVAVSDSGATVSKWDISSKDGSESPVMRKFDKSIVSSAHVAEDFVIVGHPQGALDVLDPKSLETVCSYTCFPHPDELLKETDGAGANGSKSPKQKKSFKKSLESLVINIERYGKFVIATTNTGTQKHYRQTRHPAHISLQLSASGTLSSERFHHRSRFALQKESSHPNCS